MAWQLTFAFLVTIWTGFSDGHEHFRREIPNGYSVKHPCPGRGTWEAVGHMTPSYSRPKNAFGQDVRNMLMQNQGIFDWKKVCHNDSDGDGLTNGQELGDPGCNWRPGDPAPGPSIGHPGICESDRRQCTSTITFHECPYRESTGPGSGSLTGMIGSQMGVPRTTGFDSRSSIFAQQPSTNPWQGRSGAIQTSGTFSPRFVGQSPPSSGFDIFGNPVMGSSGMPAAGTSGFVSGSGTGFPTGSSPMQSSTSFASRDMSGSFDPFGSSGFTPVGSGSMGPVGSSSMVPFASGGMGPMRSGGVSPVGSGGFGSMGPSSIGGPGMFMPQAPQPFWMRGPFRRF